MKIIALPLLSDKDESSSLRAQTPDQDGRTSSRSSSRGPSGRSSRNKRRGLKRSVRLKEEADSGESPFGSKPGSRYVKCTSAEWHFV